MQYVWKLGRFICDICIPENVYNTQIIRLMKHFHFSSITIESTINMLNEDNNILLLIKQINVCLIFKTYIITSDRDSGTAIFHSMFRNNSWTSIKCWRDLGIICRQTLCEYFLELATYPCRVIFKNVFKMPTFPRCCR